MTESTIIDFHDAKGRMERRWQHVERHKTTRKPQRASWPPYLRLVVKYGDAMIFPVIHIALPATLLCAELYALYVVRSADIRLPGSDEAVAWAGALMCLYMVVVGSVTQFRQPHRDDDL